MGIYIKGLKAPESCERCRMSRWSNIAQHYVCDIRNEIVATFVSEYESIKPDWCPIIEIPAHGRLIDADKMNDLLLKEKEKVIGSGNKLGAFAVGFAMGFIHKEPTVIEAEGGEDK